MHFLRLFFRAAALVACSSFLCPAQAAEPRPLKSVGVTVGDLGNPFFVQIVKGAQSAAERLGGTDVRFSALSSGYDLNRQVNQIDDFIAAKVDLIVLNAADSRGIAPAVRKARAAGIVVVAVDVAAEGGVDATVMSDNAQAGRIAAEYLCARLKGKGNVVIIGGPPVSAVTDRLAGASQAFAKHPEIRVLSRDQNGNGNREGGMAVMTDLLSAFPEVNAVFAINDPSAIGAALALRQARRTDIIVAGVDGAPDAVKALKDPKSAFAGTAAQDPFAMAERAVEVGFAVMQQKGGVDPKVLIPVSLVTRDNVAGFRGWSSSR